MVQAGNMIELNNIGCVDFEDPYWQHDAKPRRILNASESIYLLHGDLLQTRSDYPESILRSMARYSMAEMAMDGSLTNILRTVEKVAYSEKNHEGEHTYSQFSHSVWNHFEPTTLNHGLNPLWLLMWTCENEGRFVSIGDRFYGIFQDEVFRWSTCPI